MSILVLGSNGKVGTLLRQVWGGRSDVVWHARQAASWIDLVWDGQGALPDCDDIETVVALWGAVPPAPDLSANSTLALKAIELADRIGAARVLLCSSAAIYPRSDGLHVESGPVGPFSPYGEAKLEMEQAVARYQGPVRTCSMRIGNVMGADSLWPAIVAGKVTLDRFDTGTGPLRSYVTASHLAKAIEALAQLDDLPHCINVASYPAVTMEELATAAGAEIEWRDAPKTATPRVVLDTTLLQSLLPLPKLTPAQFLLDRPQ